MSPVTYERLNLTGERTGALFPASLASGLDGKTLYDSKLTLFLPFAGAQAGGDLAWTIEGQALHGIDSTEL
jgi:hypothetical protein